MPETVDPFIPISFLEAVRDVDTPRGDMEEEFIAELRTKRLGLSDTVHAQIRRYNEALKRGVDIPRTEAAAIAKLVGRRPDAEAVFRAAGRRVARDTYLTLSGMTRRTVLVVPSIIARPMALRQARRLAESYLDGGVTRVGVYVLLDVPEPVTLGAAPRSAGCAYYESWLRELLRLLIGGAGVVEHSRCRDRGEATCEWRADWRPLDRTT
jgi:hypothetical protein